MVSLSGATLTGSASCSFGVNVTGTAVGTQNNVSGAVTSAEGGAGGAATASLDVVAGGGAPPAIPALQPWALGLLVLLMVVAAGIALRGHKIL